MQTVSPIVCFEGKTGSACEPKNSEILRRLFRSARAAQASFW